MENKNKKEIITEEVIVEALGTSEPIFDEDSGFDFFEMVKDNEDFKDFFA